MKQHSSKSIIVLILGFAFFATSNAAIQFQQNQYEVYGFNLNQLQAASLGSTHTVFTGFHSYPSSGFFAFNAMGEVIPAATDQRTTPAVTTVQDKLYIAISGENIESNAFTVFDASNETWSRFTYGPELQGRAAASVGKYAIFAGGENFTHNFDLVSIWDTSDNTWSTSTISVPRFNMAANSIGDLAIFAGGQYASWEWAKEVDILNVTSMTWMPSYNLTSGSPDIVSVSANGYAIFVSNNIAHVFELSTQTWSTHSIIYGAKRAFVKDNVIYFLAAYYDAIEVFNTTSQTWSSFESEGSNCFPANSGRFIVFVCSTDVKIYDVEQNTIVATHSIGSYDQVGGAIGASNVGDLVVILSMPWSYYNTRNLIVTTVQISEI